MMIWPYCLQSCICLETVLLCSSFSLNNQTTLRLQKRFYTPCKPQEIQGNLNTLSTLQATARFELI